MELVKQLVGFLTPSNYAACLFSKTTHYLLTFLVFLGKTTTKQQNSMKQITS
jgi:hypothetical protein